MPSETASPSSRTVSPVEWGPVRYERAGSLLVGAALVPLAGLLVLLGTVAWVAGRAALAGDLALGDAWVFVVLLLIGGPASLVYLLIAYDQSTAERRRELLSGLGNYGVSRSALRWRWVAAGALAVGVVAVPLFELTDGLWALSFAWVALYVPLVAGSEGVSCRLDPEALTLERTHHSHDRTRTDDLGSVVRTRRLDLPWATLFLLAYRGNAWYRSTPWLVVPPELADDVERALDAALARSDGPDRASRAERIALAAVGGTTVAVGLLIGVAGGEAGGLLLALLTAPISALFLALAARL